MCVGQKMICMYCTIMMYTSEVILFREVRSSFQLKFVSKRQVHFLVRLCLDGLGQCDQTKHHTIDGRNPAPPGMY